MVSLERSTGDLSSAVFETADEESTRALGESFGRAVPGGTAISLEGGLGAGKTCFVKGVARGLGIDAEVLSPTFILVEEYRGEIPLFHFDLYRLEKLEEVEKIGFYDAIDGRNIVMVEWGDRLPGGENIFDVRVRIEIVSGSERKIEIEGPSGLLDRMRGAPG
ncbi:MAG: tRNA (adenosine(37)-N6)-threonylcarbamoyltransferase complex ATPase subunit type 1 TsaE [Bacteroidales bacterium]|nr:tRNA (adenosine(37)-N6)-threonylcarbamoyltransferase complex ATPase subunit type 1 TsaE [Candidatus Latescibacterota bacterium]